MARIKVALLTGVMYDPLYHMVWPEAQRLGLDVDIAFQGDHPALNAHLAGVSACEYDLVSTHTKYAPSQSNCLAPLNKILDPAELDDFAPALVELATVNGELLGIPRNVDVRLLHYRSDLIPTPPQSWSELFEVASRLSSADMAGFVFPGKESGLFGTFYELAEMGGASLFPEDRTPQLLNAGGRWSLRLLRDFVREKLTPKGIENFHYDEVHLAFRSGRVLMAGDWPGFYASYMDPAVSPVCDRFAVCKYPVGPTGRSLTYGGSHTFALTHKGAENAGAVQLLHLLTSERSQLFEAQRGSVPVRRSVMARIQADSTEKELARWQVLQKVIDNQILIPPKLACYPLVEEVIWKTVQAGVLGSMEVDEALESISKQIAAIRESHGE